MIEVSQALRIIAENTVDFGTESIALSDGMHRILREDWILDRDLPPYNRVTMDGIAIQYQAFKEGQRSFPVEGIAPAGTPQMHLQENGSCLEVMTGAILPQNADTVIRYEDVEIKDGQARIIDEAIVEYQQSIHFQGIDRKAQDVIVPAYTQIASPEVGIGASIGMAQVQVAKLPKIMVISTGDELVDIHTKPLAHQIRRSNVYRLRTTLQNYRIQADEAHLPDDKEELTLRLKDYLENYDVLILSGGVSKGKFDYLPEVLTNLGVEKLFHKIRQRPGKPFWFGKFQDQCTTFALPGNPVSSFVCLQRYFTHWLNLSLGKKETPRPMALLTKEVQFKPDLTYFLEVSLSYNEQGQILAEPKKGNGSGDFANLVTADAFIELPRGKNVYEAGEVHPIFYYRPL
ncbi:MAG: molybdopterin molybdotransferase MoeA [Bacteroidota bacterium]